MILHTVHLSPFQHSSLRHCLQAINPGDGLLLIEDGVYALNSSADSDLWQWAEHQGKLYVLVEDCQIRAVPLPDHNNCQGIDYTGFVQLVEHYSKQLAWS